MSMRTTIEKKLRRALEPVHLEVIDETHMHDVEPDAESHFRVRVVADAFEGEPLVRRHQAVYRALAEEMDDGIHALGLDTMTPDEWEEAGDGLASPPCLGGSSERPDGGHRRDGDPDGSDGEDPERVVKSDEEWRQQLTAEQYHVTRQSGTERPFSGEYHDCEAEGLYRCVCCGNPLFDSRTKFESGTGWPSFWAPVDEERVASAEDRSLSMRRVEVLCSRCDAHLGHVFPDGPEPTGQRYCINSAALRLDRRDGTSDD